MTDKNKKKKFKKKPWDIEYDENVFADPWPVEIDTADLDKLKGLAERICDSASLESEQTKNRAAKLRNDAERLKKILEKKEKKVT